MENERKINWLSVFIKAVIVFIFILIIIWLITKINVNNTAIKELENNLETMEKVSIDYFKTIDLPLENGKSIKVTLGDLIEKKLIVSEENINKNDCDLEKSYSEIIREKNKYLVKTTLTCGKDTKTIQKDFLLKDCKNCNNDVTKDETDNENKITYYEHIKETTNYTKWARGQQTGNNIENKYEYYGVDYQTYYTIGVIPENKKTITYTLKLDNVPNKNYYFTTIDDVDTFKDSDEKKYLNEESISLYKGTENNIPSKNISKHVLRNDDFTYQISPYYREGNFYIRITITIHSVEKVETYYDDKLQQELYIIPLKLNVKFASNVISETKPDGKYETISYYRYVTTNKEILWSTNTSVDGYVKTGNVRYE